MREASLPEKVSVESLVARVADDFLERQKNGERPDIEEYAARYPEAAELLHKVLAALQLIGTSQIGGSGLPQAPAEPAGTLGDFCILREVGRGGMGVVYEAEQISLCRRVALKVLPFAATMDARQLQRFHNEARAAACLHHPHIVPVYAVGCERSVHYYAMQFIDGQSLEGFLRHLCHTGVTAKTIRAARAADRDQPAPISAAPDAVTVMDSRVRATTQPVPQDAAHFRQVAEWGIAVAEALEHAHSLGIVHRDIKPGNLLLDQAGRLWVTDFGLARTVNDAGLTLTGDLMGTLRYMSPEQALAKHGLVDHRTDIYSLGVTLFELLTLRPAIDGLDREEVLNKIAFDEPPAARQLNAAIPVELETIVGKAMSKEPAERYATARELADDLRRFLDDKPIRARPPSLRQRLRKWARRHRAVIWTAATLLVFAAAALAAGGVWHMLEIEATLAEVRQRERELRQHSYIQDIVLAWQAMREGEQERMRGLLDRHIPEDGQEDLRGFEWYYFQRRSRGLLQEAAKVAAHEGGAYCVTYSPDGRTLASAGMDGVIRFWDARTLHPKGELRGGQSEINEVAFAPNGKSLASAGDDRTVWLWDLASMRQQAILRPEGCRNELESLAISPDGKVLAAGGRDGGVWSWDFASGKLKAALNPGAGSIHYLTFAPDGRFLAIANHEGGVLLLDPATLQERGKFHPSGPMYSLAISHDGRTLAGGSGLVGRILLWDLTTKRRGHDLPGHEGSILQSLSFSPDDTLLVSGGEDGRVRLWDVRSGGLRSSERGHTRHVWGTAFAPDGEWLATAGQDGTVKLWRIPGDGHRRTIQLASDAKQGAVNWLAFAPDGQTLFTRTNSGELGRWSALSGQRVKSAGGTAASITRAALAPASRLATVASDKRELRVQDLSGAEVLLYRHAQPISALAISPDGERVAFADDSPAVWMWEIGSSSPRGLSRLSGVCKCLAFAPDGRTIAAAAAARVLLLDAAQGQSLAVLSGHEREILSLAFSPDGRLLATAAGDDHTIRIWELASERERYYLWKHRRSVNAVAFSPDGKTLASADGVGEVILWNVAGGQELMRLEDHRGDIFALAFSPDGKILAAGGLGTDGKSAKVTLWYADGARPNSKP
jgi:eukaryotic-like serine/threonine-protein kinase